MASLFNLDLQLQEDRLIRIFEKTGGDSKVSHRFDSWDSDTQSRLRTLAEIPEDSRELLAYVEGGCWTVLTLDKLAWKNSNCQIQIMTKDLSSVSPILVSKKEEMSSLVVETHEGKKHTVHFAKGAPTIAFWSVLKTVIQHISFAAKKQSD